MGNKTRIAEKNQTSNGSSSNQLIADKAFAIAEDISKYNPTPIEKIEGMRKDRVLPPRQPALLNDDNPKKRPPSKAAPRGSSTYPTTLVKDRNFYKKCFIEAYKVMSTLGLEQSVIARLFNIDRMTLSQRRSTDPEIEKKFIEAMQQLEVKLGQQMLIQSLGYSVTETKIVEQWIREKPEKKDKDGKVVQEKIDGHWESYRRESVEKWIPGNQQLFIMYMTNKFPDLWKVSKELVSSKGRTYDAKPGKRDRKKIESLATDVLEASADNSVGEH